MKYIILLALVGMIILCMGLQYAPAEQPMPIEIPAPKPEVIPLARELKPIPIIEATPTITVDMRDAEYMAKTLAGEYFGPDLVQRAAVCWCILNRCDAWGQSVEEVVTAPNQFLGYRESNPVNAELLEMAVDVLTRWEREKLGKTDVGRVLPKDYLWFAANSDYTKNIFRNAYEGGDRWGWELPSPYEEGINFGEENS